MMEEAEKIGRRVGVHFRGMSSGVSTAWPVSVRTSMLQDLEKGRPLEIDALLTVVQEMRRLVDVETPTIDTVLAWVQQMGREAEVCPTFPEVPLGQDGTSVAVDWPHKPTRWVRIGRPLRPYTA